MAPNRISTCDRIVSKNLNGISCKHSFVQWAIIIKATFSLLLHLCPGLKFWHMMLSLDFEYLFDVRLKVFSQTGFGLCYSQKCRTWEITAVFVPGKHPSACNGAFSLWIRLQLNPGSLCSGNCSLTWLSTWKYSICLVFHKNVSV